MSLSPEQQEQYIAIWAKAVDTQMHFNEMSVKSRQLGLTFVAAALGVAVVLITRGTDYVIKVPLASPWFQIHISVILIIASALALAAVRTLDLNVYHKMLRGAVTFGEDFEQQYMKQIFALDKGMTQAISHFSRYEDASKTVEADTGRYTYTGKSQVTAEQKIRNFYKTAFGFLIVAALAVFVITNLEIWRGALFSANSPAAAPRSAPAVVPSDVRPLPQPTPAGPVDGAPKSQPADTPPPR